MSTISTISNEFIKVEVLDIGCDIYRLFTKNKNGEFENIVLSFKDTKDYEAMSGPNFGAVIGQISGRIRNGEFELNGTTHQLEKNNGEHHLHGGTVSFARRKWNLLEQTPEKLVYELKTSAEENQFPGNIDTKVTYELIGNTLEITYEAISTEDTLWDLTQHTYWNLSGNMKEHDVLDHLLQINSDFYGEVDENGMSENVLHPVDGTPFDVRDAKTVRSIVEQSHEQLSKVGGGFDHPFTLDGVEDAATLEHLESGRKITVRTDKPSIICYMGNQLEEEDLLDAGFYAGKHAGICLETQYLPNSINLPHYGEAPILKAGKAEKSVTQFIFDVVE